MVKIIQQEHGFWLIKKGEKEATISIESMDRQYVFLCLNEIGCTPTEIGTVEKKITPKPKPILPFLTSAELMNTPKEKGFVVQHLLLKNTVNQLLSPPANFKSLMALQLAICVANGKDFFGFKTKKCAVAYLDKENNRQLLSDRLKKLFSGLKLKKKRFPVMFLLKEGMLDDNSFLEKLSAYVKENKIGFIIFDTLVRFNSGDENSAHDMNRIYQAFVELQKETQAAILFLHHTNRQGEFRGSSDLMGQVDTMFSIERCPKTNKFTLKNPKNRVGEINDVNGEVFFTDNYITIERAEEKTEEETKEGYNKFQLARAFVLDFAKAECPTALNCFARAELLTALSAWNSEKKSPISKRMVDDVLKHLVKIKILRKGDKQGEYYLNNAENERISKWIAPIGVGNALDISEPQTIDGLNDSQTPK